MSKMTDGEIRAYRRGYQSGLRRNWPEHQPPSPPDEIVAQLMRAAKMLRDCVDGELAKFDPDDEINNTLGPGIDAVDDAMTAITEWLTAKEQE